MNMRHILIPGMAALATATLAASAAGADPSKNLSTEVHALKQVREGRETFRYATFGDEAFWGDTLGLHLAIAGAANGGVGPGVSPKTALAVGLKVDVAALPRSLVRALARGRVNLDDPKATLELRLRRTEPEPLGDLAEHGARAGLHHHGPAGAAHHVRSLEQRVRSLRRSHTS